MTIRNRIIRLLQKVWYLNLSFPVFFLVLNGSHCQKLKQDKKIYRNENVASLGLLCEIWHKIGKLQHRKVDSHETKKKSRQAEIKKRTPN